MNVHFLSNSPIRINSGFGIVCRNLALGLSKLGHDVSVSNMQGIYDTEYWNNITIYPLNSIGGASGNSFYTNEVQQFVRNLKDSKAECVIFIYPCYDDTSILNRLHEVHPNTLWYFVVEGENLPVNWINEAKKVKKVVPMTEQGRKELSKAGLNGNLEKTIYHGHDPSIFKHINLDDIGICKWSDEKYQLIGDRKKLCQMGCFKCDGLSRNCDSYEIEKVVMNFADDGGELVGDVSKLGKIKDTFGVDCIYGFIGDNNGKRKRIDLLLNSYMSLPVEVKKDSMLLLHTLPNSTNIGDGYNLVEIIKKWEEKHGKGSSGKISFVYGYDGAGNSWSDNALNAFYNIIDANVSASSGESFCLPVIESMACGKPNIAPNFSSFTELVGDRGLLAKLGGYETLTNGARRGIVSTKDLKDCMERLYNDKDERKKFGDRAGEWVKQYTWDNIVKNFDDVLGDLSD